MTHDFDTDGPLPGGTGDSIADAVVVSAPDTWTGVDREYECLSERFGPRGAGWQLIQQSLIRKDGRAYDRMDIQLADGTERSVFFDITSFFGR